MVARAALKRFRRINENETRHEFHSSLRRGREGHATQLRSPTDEARRSDRDSRYFPRGKTSPRSIADVLPARSYAARIVNSWRHAADGTMQLALLRRERRGHRERGFPARP